MKTIERRRRTWLAALAAIVTCGLVSTIAWFEGVTATFFSSALALTVYHFTFPLVAGPLDPRGSRVRTAFICFVWTSWAATVVCVATSAFRGHWI